MTKDQLRVVAEWLSALGGLTRMAIVRALSTGEKTVTELAKVVKTEIVNVSQHLKVMKDAGVVTCNRDGRFMRYSLLGATATAVEIVLTHASGVRIVISLI